MEKMLKEKVFENTKHVTENRHKETKIFSSILPINFQFLIRIFNTKNNLKEKLNRENIIAYGSILLLFLASIFLITSHSDFTSLTENNWLINNSLFINIFGFLLLFRIGFLFLNIYLNLKYKAIESVSDEKLPTCTIIVPAYNEGKQVWHTVMSLAKSNYPSEKLQIFVIDDGSKDDTWDWIQNAKNILGDRISIFKQPQNKGKRHALYKGFKEGNGEVFVTLDSDSIITKETLRNLVSPLVVNKECGAVAGNVQVLNQKDGIIPKMLNVSFVFSFEFVRSAESMFGSVLCTPGALAAYRADAVQNCVEEWINQTFMGEPSDIGEDRALTNMILKQGYKVLFQKNALVYTNVPETYKGLYKMYIRWGRSNVRENISMAKFIFTNFRKDSKIGTRLLFIQQGLTMLMIIPSLLILIYLLIKYPVFLLCTTLVGILIHSSIQVFFYSIKYNKYESVWAYAYGLLNLFGLFWVMPYSIFTANKKGWLTRG